MRQVVAIKCRKKALSTPCHASVTPCFGPHRSQGFNTHNTRLGRPCPGQDLSAFTGRRGPSDQVVAASGP